LIDKNQLIGFHNSGSTIPKEAGKSSVFTLRILPNAFTDKKVNLLKSILPGTGHSVNNKENV
jgi:hypothetical protein